MWQLKLEEKVECAGGSHRGLDAIQQQMSWPGVVSEVRILGKMRLTKTAGQASPTHTQEQAFDEWIPAVYFTGR